MFASKDALFAKQASSAYQISRSLRFRNSATSYLQRTPASAGSRTAWTWSGWVKIGLLSASNTNWLFFAGTNGTNDTGIYFGTDFTLQFFNRASSTINGYILTPAVFRDVSAWYHVTAVYDASNATATDRMRLYVNGVRQTVTVNTQLASGTNSILNSTVAHNIGSINSAGTANNLDGYLAEVNFIDGQALTPSSFGAFDTNGVWQPKAYVPTGTGYGTNGFYLPFSATPTSSFSSSFNGSTQYLTTATNAGLGLGTSDFTVEYWMNVSAATNGTTLCCAGDGTTSYDCLFGYITSGTLVTYLTSTPGVWNIASNRTILSSITTGRWYHIAFTRSGSTFRVFADGIQVDTFTSAAALYQTANQFVLGRGQGVGYFNGLLSNVRVIKGTALYTSNFTPSAQPLTAVTNTQLLTLQSSSATQDNSPNNLSITNSGTVTTSAATPWINYVAGQDSSGAGNNWTSTNVNVTSSGTTYDSMIDSPTNYADGGNGRGNYAVLNPLDNPSAYFVNATFSAANLNIAATSGGQYYVHPTISNNTGKFYQEYTVTGLGAGGALTNSIVISAPGNPGAVYCAYDKSGQKYVSGSWTTGWTAWTANDVIGVAVDYDAGTAAFYLNGTLQGTLTFGSQGSAPLCTANNAQAGSGGTVSVSFNAGQRPFSISSVPSGFSALNTQNLPTPTIAAGNKYFDATTYIGNSSNPRTFTGLGFQPDFIWLKRRSLGSSHLLLDAVRGFGLSKELSSDATLAEGNSTTNTAAYGSVTAATTDGFTVNTGSINADYVNTSSQTYVGWQWKAGGTGVTNTSGSITSTVSANTSAGFSVVTGVSTGASGSISVGHGLGVTPSMVIFKNRDLADDWYTWHTSLGASTSGYNLKLDTTAAVATNANIWGGAGYGMTSTTIGLGQGNLFSASNQKFVCYAFAPVAGYSAFGSYTGNGSADGPFVYTGFRPRFILFKPSTAVQPWNIFDTSRDLYNVEGQYLQPNTSGAEGTSVTVDGLSNGFKIRQSAAYINGSGDTIIYAAFAENPFKTARAR